MWLADKLSLSNLIFVEDSKIDSLDFNGCVCFEVFEHIRDPFVTVSRLLSNTCNYLFESSSFTVPSPGHLQTFIHDGVLLTGRQTGFHFPKYIRKLGFQTTAVFWNNRPRVWERITV